MLMKEFKGDVNKWRDRLSARFGWQHRKDVKSPYYKFNAMPRKTTVFFRNIILKFMEKGKGSLIPTIILKKK